MIWNKRIFIIAIVSFALCLMTTTAFCAPNYYIGDYSYTTHYEPGETVSARLHVFNNTGAEIVNYYVNVVLTNQKTGAEVATYLDTGTFTLAANSSRWELTNNATWTAVEGTYTVTIILYNSGDVEQHRVYGSEPIRVGRTEEYVSGFPNIVDFGVLPYGRYMLPHPVRIHWNFYQRNRLNKDHPWYMRIYTDNSTKYKGIQGAIYQNRRTYITSKIWVRSNVEGSPSGLVSSDGKYTIPLRVWCLNYGPDWEEIGWNPNMLGPPPVNDDYVWKGPLLDDGKRDSDRRAWLWVPDYADMTSDRRTWRNLIGRDPYNINFIGDNNPTGDFTLDSPFDIYFATEASPATVMGKYSGKLIIEIYTP